jgi:hypothetical protein
VQKSIVPGKEWNQASDVEGERRTPLLKTETQSYEKGRNSDSELRGETALLLCPWVHLGQATQSLCSLQSKSSVEIRSTFNIFFITSIYNTSIHKIFATIYKQMSGSVGREEVKSEVNSNLGKLKRRAQ